MLLQEFKVWQNRRDDYRSSDESTEAPANIGLRVVTTALRAPASSPLFAWTG